MVNNFGDARAKAHAINEVHGDAHHQTTAGGRFLRRAGGAITLIGTAIAGIPVSTTQTISGSIMGVGAIQRFSSVRWGRGREDPVGLDPHDSGLGDRRGGDLGLLRLVGA